MSEDISQQLDYNFEFLDESEINDLIQTNIKLNERLKDSFCQYVRPLMGHLLRVLNLDIHYIDGENNQLTFLNEKSEKVKVLDMAGGYGANLLGHKNSELIKTLIHSAQNAAPFHTQGSLKKEVTLLSKKISSLLFKEVPNQEHWISNFSNSGAEAVEAALKSCLLHYKKTQTKYKNQNILQFNALTKMIANLNEQEEQFFLKLIAQKFPYEFTSLSQLNKFIYELNIKAINREPQILCLEDAFHGKTLGALLLTDSTMYTESFGLNQFSTFVIHSKKTNDYVEEHINHSLKSFTQITITKTDLDFERVSISNLAATFIEPIQGECGIHPLDKDFLTHLNTLSRKNKIPFVSDEIQAGLFRCGKMAALHNYDLDADIYCFAKGLGGSLTKIGVTSINPSVYSHEFSILHTSTFCEDPLSSNIAFKVLEVLERDLIQNKMYQKIKLKEELQQLQTEFPSFIKEIRGEGLLLSLEIDSALANQCMEFKIFEHSGYLGHFLSSALLHNERVRMTPSLSSPNTLRVQPSIYFSSEETKWFIGGLRNLFNAAKELDMTYFYQHVFPGEELLTADLLPSDVNHTKKATKPLAVFFCHMINIDHAKTLVTSQKFIDDKVYQKKISKIVEVLDFAPLYRKDLKGVKQDIELMFMVHPITSFDIVKAMKTKNSDAIVEKLQRGIDYVKSLGATTIGLGQFTSIVSYNGLKLDARGLNITTGNAYTTAISVKACREACKDKGIDIGQTHIGCIGMAGNIVSVTASLLADDCKQMTFIYHTALSESPKYIKTMIGFFKNVARSTSINTFTTNVQKLMNEIKYDFSVKNTLEIVSMLEAKNILKLSTEIKEINNCEIILSGASSPKPFIDASGFKSGTIVIDIGVPTNIVKDSLTPTTVYLQGGLASLPKINNEQQFLDPPSFNLKPGTSYACLSETLILTYANKANIQNTGELTKEVVLETQKLGEEMGFDLAAFKLKDSL